MGPDEEAVERFRRRTRGTSLAVLQRNLDAGAYGPTGSPRRTVAQRVLAERAASEHPPVGPVTSRADRIETLTQRVAWVAVAALFLAALGVILALARG